MALFDNFKQSLRNAVEGALSQPRSDGPVTEGHAMTERETEWDSKIPVPVTPWRRKTDVDIPAPEEELPSPQEELMKEPGGPAILGLADAQSKAMMDEAQGSINADNSGAEEVTDLTTGSPTGQVNVAQTPAEIGLSSATSDASTVPANLNARGLDDAQVRAAFEKRQKMYEAENAPTMPSGVSSGTGSGSRSVFARFKPKGTADLSYVDAAREKANKAVDFTQELTMRWAAARSGIHYAKGMGIGDIPAAALVLATKDIPTPAYVTEAQKYYQSAVAQYGHDITLLKEAMAQDAKLQESFNIVAQESNARSAMLTQARDSKLTMAEYTGGEQISFLGAKGMRYSAGATKEQRESMQKALDAGYKFVEEYDKKVTSGEDVSVYSPAVARYWYSAMVSGQLDANAGASRLLGYFSHENTWSEDDKMLAIKLRSRGFNEQSVVTAVVANNVPQLKQNIKELAALNGQAELAGLGKRSGSTLNTVYNSTDLGLLDGAMQELETQKRGRDFAYLSFRYDALKPLETIAKSPDGNLGKLYGDSELNEIEQNIALTNDPGIKRESLRRMEQHMAASANPGMRLTGSVLTKGLGRSSVKDRMDFLRDNNAIVEAGATGLTGKALTSMADSFRRLSGTRDLALGRKEASEIFAKYKDAPQSELIKHMMQLKVFEGMSESVIKRAISTADTLGSRVGTGYAERFWDYIEAETMSLAATTPVAFAVSAQSLAIMKEDAVRLGGSIAESQIHRNADGSAQVMLAPQAAALHQAMADCGPEFQRMIAEGRVPTDGEILTVLATRNPKALAALETTCGPYLVKTLRGYFKLTADRYERGLQAQAQAQARASVNTK